MIFEENKINNTEYYIKELNSYITIPIETKDIKILDNYIEITYITKTNDNIYKYVLEVQS